MARSISVSALIFLATMTFSAAAYGFDLTGSWREDDSEAIYFVHQVGDELFWFGEGPGEWANVAHGRIKGRTATLRWADVPKYRSNNSGELVIEIVSADFMRATRRSGGFGGKTWKRIKADEKDRPPLRDYL